VTICNLNVLVAALYRILCKSELEETIQSKTPNPSPKIGLSSNSRVSRSRNISCRHPFVLGPPLAVAVGGITTGGPLGNGSAGGWRNGLDRGFRIQTKTVEWSHPSSQKIKGNSNLSFKDIPFSLNLEDSEDEISLFDSNEKKTRDINFDKDLERGNSYSFRNFSKPVHLFTPNTKKTNRNSKSNENKDGNNGS
jgi:hypothetical protein